MEKVAQSEHDERDRAETLEWTGESSGNLKWYHFHAITDLVPIIMLQFNVQCWSHPSICYSLSINFVFTATTDVALVAPTDGSVTKF